MFCRQLCDFLKGISIKGFYTLSEGRVTLFIYTSKNPKDEKDVHLGKTNHNWKIFFQESFNFFLKL